ncbi:TPA: hypothetical protein RI771_003573 [Vibrio cholerae]|nr:hypothetical protein [Vibrio cholerae]HDV5449902.1 hypothetical protein [Vibrio cholerae]HDV5505266.1 hypothetical protein [Vibrio cholerae]HDV5599049.1 hypothetical protein [Vibrio cholerae]HDV5654551.1 hypothetical protein [Vibrio cholerae]
MSLDINSFVSAIVGGAATLSGVWIANRFQEKNLAQQQLVYIQGVLNGLHAELEALWLKYDERMGSHVEQLNEGEPLSAYWPITQDYFTFYGANASTLGQLSDKELLHDIVKVYRELKSLVDSYRMNNVLVEKYEIAHERYQSSQTELNKQSLVNAEASLIEYAISLKELHVVCKQMITPLLKTLRKKC